MRWFKHYTDSLDDPFIHDLMDEFGAVGYLAYFGIIEIICKENGQDLTGKLSISPTYLRRKLRTSQGKLRQVYDFCQAFGKLSVNFSEKIWEFEFTKIAEIKDNYTKDLQAQGKKPSKQKEGEVEEEVDKKKKNKDIELPPWIPLDAWDGFVKMRKKIKAPIEGRAITLLINKLEAFKNEGADIGKILDQSTMNSWKSVYPLKDGGGNGQGNSRQNTSSQAGGGEDYEKGAIGPD